MKRSSFPPRPATWILSRLRRYSEDHGIQDDLDYEFRIEFLRKGRRRAVLWYWGQVLFALGAQLKHDFTGGEAMLRNNLVITSRIFRRQKLFSLINIAGLSAGIACSFFIFIWVRNEQGFNRFHKKIGQIYLVRSLFRSRDAETRQSGTPPLLGAALSSEYPEVAGAVRLFHWKPELPIRSGAVVFRENVQFSDPSLFDVFTFPMIKGTPPREADGPDGLVISERMAGRLFGGANPVGKTVTLDNRIDLTVRGVMKDIPRNSSITFDIWASLPALVRVIDRPEFLEDWRNLAFRTYVELEEGVDPDSFGAKIAGRINRSEPRQNVESFVYPFKDYYLKLLEKGKRVRLFSLIATLVLLMACFNFANLSTARSEKRAKEVGIRRIAGAKRFLLVRQFLGESILFALVSLGLALGLVILFLPVFRQLTGFEITAGNIWRATPWPLIFGMTVLAGFVSGLYPAFVLSSIRPARTVKGEFSSTRGRGRLRKVLVLVQSTSSILFVLGFIVISAQIRYMKTHNPGYSRESVLYFPIQGERAGSSAALKAELLKNPGIERVSAVTDLPVYIGSIVVGGHWEGKPADSDPPLTFFGADSDFLETLDVELVQGRFFDRETPPQSGDVVINEKLASFLGRADVVGTQITSLDRNFRVIGVVKDFNFRPFDQDLGPLVVFHNDQIMPFRFMLLRCRPGGISRTLADLQTVGRRLNLEAPLEFKFLDDEAAAQYENEDKLRGLVSVFMSLAVIIAALGLFGLAAFMAERRVREIGIRKILGASSLRVTSLLSLNFLKWILLSNLIAWPAGYYFMSRWLENYAFHIDLSLGIFALAAGLLLVVGVGTVSIQALRAASADPVDSLRRI